jgi:hypothetical protein
MASSKNTPSLPGGSRMQMPTSGSDSTPKIKGAAGKISKRIISSAKGKGMKGSNPYCD